MYGFDKFIIDKGFKPYIFDTEKGRHLVNRETNGKTYPSTIGNLDVRFVRIGSELQRKIEAKEKIEEEDYKNNYIICGLSELHKPPTLISPRPKIMRKTKIDGGYKVERLDVFDDYINRMLKDTSHEEVFERMFNQKMIKWS